MQGDKKRRVRRISHTPQGGATAVNAPDGTLMVEKGNEFKVDFGRLKHLLIKIVNYELILEIRK